MNINFTIESRKHIDFKIPKHLSSHTSFSEYPVVKWHIVVLKCNRFCMMPSMLVYFCCSFPTHWIITAVGHDEFGSNCSKIIDKSYTFYKIVSLPNYSVENTQNLIGKFTGENLNVWWCPSSMDDMYQCYLTFFFFW